MNNDPIVAEVRSVRDELARRLGYDIHAIFAQLRSADAWHDPHHPLVRNAEEWASRKEGTLLHKEPTIPDMID